jgi:hypothetical protein
MIHDHCHAALEPLAMNYMDMSYSATPPTRGVKTVSPATRLNSQRDIPKNPGHAQRGSKNSACIAMPLDDPRQSSVRSASGRLPGAKIGRAMMATVAKGYLDYA